ncbi:MAG: hypothetical protein ACLP01_22725 [Solirubrobacteraceae bacterium]
MLSAVRATSVALPGDVTIAAEVLIDDALAQRPPASLAVVMNGF